MKAKNTVAITIVIILTALLTYVVVFGLNVGIYTFRPIDGIQQGLDITGGVYTVYEAKDTSIEDFENKMAGAIAVLRTRLDSKGFTEATIARQGNDRIRVEIPINNSSEVQDPNEISQFIGSPAKLQFLAPDGSVIMEGEDIVSARAVLQSATKPVVSFKLSDHGATVFADATAKYIKQQISISLDGTIISAPTVNGIIPNGEGIIESESFTTDNTEAQDLAMQIESGALPLDLQEIEVRSMSASLGFGALESSIMAGLIGLAVLFLFMLIIYRLPGLVACIALLLYIDFVILMIGSVPGVQLTLPGIAGIILGIGMAVDANVIIYERFKEEIRNGKTLRVANQAGFKKAFVTILDSNITTLISAIVLAIFGTGTIKSFAFTLIISICVSMFTACLISRGILNMFINVKPNQNVNLYVPPKKLFGKKEGGEAV